MNRDSFDSFSKWAPIVLQDFNEIDRYLIPQDQIFEYLSAIQEIQSLVLRGEFDAAYQRLFVFLETRL